MPDWKPEIRQRLISLKLEPTREAAIVEELAQPYNLTGTDAPERLQVEISCSAFSSFSSCSTTTGIFIRYLPYGTCSISAALRLVRSPRRS